MTETKARKEKFIELPNDLLDKFNGFSLDFGEYVFLLLKIFCKNVLGKFSFLV